MYVKCLICGKKLKFVNHAHLKKHGITYKQYLEMYAKAQVMSIELKKKISENTRKNIKEITKICKKCGKVFVTKSARKVLCDKCQKEQLKIYMKNYNKMYYELHKRKIRFIKSLSRKRLGSIDKEDLDKLELEIKNGKRIRDLRLILKYQGYCHPHTARAEFVLIDPPDIYCGECGNKIVKALPNKYYTCAEFVCSNCGLVYSI